MNITVLGVGNIGSSLVDGLIRDNSVVLSDIVLSDINQSVLDKYSKLGISTNIDNAKSVENADIIFLCVKPWLVQEVLGNIASSLKSNQIVVSFAAGVSIESISKLIGNIPLCRVIPNTAMAVNEAMICLASATWTNDETVTKVEELLSKVGVVVKVKETELDAATILGSCGTAFALRYLRASVEAGVQIGLRPDTAKVLVAQAMIGAAKILFENGTHPEAEIDKVTTPAGSTIRGLNAMESNGFSASIINGILSAYSCYGK